jgi:hypothetical protein
MKTNTKTKNLIGLCIHCPTELEYKQACKIASENGWSVGGIDKRFSEYGDKTCLYFGKSPVDYCQYGSYQWFSLHNYVVTTMGDLLFMVGGATNGASEPPATVDTSYTLTIKNIAGDSIRCSKEDLMVALDNYVKGLK